LGYSRHMVSGCVEKSIIIIGAGIAGLSAGCYARINGYRTTIFEMHDAPGGLCTGWNRHGYTIDGCIHWLVGSRPGTGLRGIWEDIGALHGQAIVDHEEFLRVEAPDGRTVILYTDVERLERHLLELSPRDRKPITDLTRAIRQLSGFDMPTEQAPELRTLRDRVRGLPALLRVAPLFIKYQKTTLAQFANRFSDPLLREAFGSFYNLDGFPFLAMAFTLAWMNAKNAGYPIGGSLDFAQSVERRYLELGGEIRYGARVEQILVERDRAVGVRLEGGEEHRSDWVVSAADGHATINKMLGGKYIDDALRAVHAKLKPFDPLVYLAVGVARDLSAEPHSIVRRFREPVTIAGRSHMQMSFRHFCYDPTLSPPGKTVIVGMLRSDYDYWKALAADRARYDAEKQAIMAWFVDQLEERFGGIRNGLEMTNVATPLTFERYTGNWRGSFEGWQITSDTLTMHMKKTLPGLGGFYMIGQWVNPGGGLPPAAVDGNFVTRLICNADGRAFRTGRAQHPGSYAVSS